MIKQLLYKWFGLEETPCPTCAVLRDQLEKSETERRELLHRLMDNPQTEPLIEKEKEDLEPVKPTFIPWRVRQQMLEAEDKKRAELLRKKNEELEKELGLDGTNN